MVAFRLSPFFFFFFNSKNLAQGFESVYWLTRGKKKFESWRPQSTVLNLINAIFYNSLSEFRGDTMPCKVGKMQQYSKDDVHCDKMFYSRIWWEGLCYNWKIQGDDCRAECLVAWAINHGIHQEKEILNGHDMFSYEKEKKRTKKEQTSTGISLSEVSMLKCSLVLSKRV